MMLTDALPPAPDANGPDPDAVYNAFAEWAKRQGLSLYPHQEEALIEVVSGANVILSTPTGSGKSLVAAGAHFTALASGQRSFYTAPIKALVSEKFFALIDTFGAKNVGMMTGDASVNPSAPIICCTAEVLANIALRDGADADVGQVVMDEFHFYADPDRGWAWQVPLIELPRAQFVLMSATLGDVRFFEQDLTRRTGRPTAVVQSDERPVPLTFEYVLTPLHETLKELLETRQAPVYVVHFTQAAALEQAQALMSINVCTRAEKDAIAETIGNFRFTSGFGKTLSRLVRHGIGVHHAGMLPKYRRLVETLAQAGQLKVICGTDTLGVGINVPIRTVLFTALSKYDGTRTRLLQAREFHQIAGRAGRAGYDTVGTVVVQAPEHVVENEAALAKAGDDPKKRRKVVRKKPPQGFVSWGEPTFERLVAAEPEPLKSRFTVSHAMLLNVLNRPGDAFAAMKHLLTDNHEDRAAQRALIHRAIQIYRALLAGGVVEQLAEPDELGRRCPADRGPAVRLRAEPAAVPVRAGRDRPARPRVAVVPAGRAVGHRGHPGQPAPGAVGPAAQGPRRGHRADEGGRRRVRDADGAAGVGDLPAAAGGAAGARLRIYRQGHPWVADHELAPKSVVRDMYELAMTFTEYVGHYGLSRSEGLVLRYLADAYKALRQTVPEDAKTEELIDLIEWLGELVRQVDSSLIDEWERLRNPDADPAVEADRDSARPRSPATSGPSGSWSGTRCSAGSNWPRWATTRSWANSTPTTAGTPTPGRDAIEPLLRCARRARHRPGRPRPGPAHHRPSPAASTASVRQIFDDPAGDHDWGISAEVDLDASDEAGTAVLRITSVGQL